MRGECNHCGKCCFIGKERKVPCRNLLILPDGKSRCRIYQRRLGAYCGTVDGIRWKCNLYAALPINEKIKGCPVNTKEEELYLISSG